MKRSGDIGRNSYMYLSLYSDIFISNINFYARLNSEHWYKG